MIEVVIDSVKVSLVSQYRLVVLKERFGERYLPIWIGPFEADAITYQLQGHEVPRPLTHDLLKKVIQTMGAELKHVVVTDLRNETFYANLVLSVNGRQLEVDSRPSDAIALAVRANAKIYVANDVMDKVSIVPEEDISGRMTEEEEEKLSAFSDFIDTLDLDDLGKKTS
jgi:hypothetical protein